MVTSQLEIERSQTRYAAHEICSKFEFDVRKMKGATTLLVMGHRKLTKKDLFRLTRDRVFQYVLRRYVRK